MTTNNNYTTHNFTARMTAEACLKDYIKKGYTGYILTTASGFEVRVSQ